MDRLRPGDHACLSFASDEDRWRVLRQFALNGIGSGEKVMCFVDRGAAASEAADRICGTSELARRAQSRGQLIVSSTSQLREPDAPLDTARIISQMLDAIEAACQDGYTGLRGTGYMASVLYPGMDPSALIDYEHAVQQRLFPDQRYTGLCQYDRRWFGDSLTATMTSIHPVSVIERIGALHVTFTSSGLRLAGECDLVTRAELAAALRQARERATGTIVLDLTDLSFLDARCATDILGLAAGLHDQEALEVRCGPHLRRILLLLGAESIPHLVITRDES